MAVGRKRGSRSAGTESAAGPGQDGAPGASALDGLLPRVARGDSEAFASVYDLVAGAVYGLAHRTVGDRSRAEQVAAEVLLEVWRSASRFSPAEGSGLGWVMTMGRGPARRAAAGAAPAGGLRPSGTRGAERPREGLLTLGNCP